VFEVKIEKSTNLADESLLNQIQNKLDLKKVTEAEQMVEDFLQASQIYFDQAQFAVTKKQEKDLIDNVYAEVLKIDQFIG